MFDKHATQEEDKLVLLCAMDRLGACTQEQLLRFVVETSLQNQFQFYLAIAELREAGLIRETKRAEGTLLLLTPQGRESLEMFGSRIRASLQEKLDESGAAWRRKIRDEQQMPADYAQTDDGYAVTLRAIEDGAEIFSVKLTAQTKEQAKQFCARWPNSAPEIYRMIMEKLGGTQEEEK